MSRRKTAREKCPCYWIMPPIAAWFAGERNIPITAHCFPFCGQLDVLWDAYAEIHPDAQRPADWPAHKATDAEQTAARAYLYRGRPRWYGGAPRHIGRE